MGMTLMQAIARLQGRDDWEAVLEYLGQERESCLVDFQNPEHTSSPQHLARLAGEIAALDRTLKILSDVGPDAE